MSVANVPPPPGSAPKAYWGRNASRAKALDIRKEFQSKRVELGALHRACAVVRAGTSSLAEYLPWQWQQTRPCETRSQEGRSRQDEGEAFPRRSPRTQACAGCLAET